MTYSSASVDRVGQLRKNNWVYGSYSTQEKLLRFHGKGPVLLGINPDDLSAPAIAFAEDGSLISEGIEAVKAGEYGSAEGIRDSK